MILKKLKLLWHLVTWRVVWDKRDTHYQYHVPGNPKFMGPREAVKLIQDGDVCLVAGIAGNQRVSIIAWAMKEMFLEGDGPKDLTLVSAGGQGGREKAPGTLEELALPGLITRFICAHHETYKAFLRLVEQGQLQAHCLPQGIMNLLVEAASRGDECRIESDLGKGTFFDPRVGNGSLVFEQQGEQNFIELTKDGNLRYTLPPINVTIFNAPGADKQGNIYIEGAATICESREAALATKKHGGKVIVNVGEIVPHQPDKIFLAHEHVDAVVYYPKTEQTASFFYPKPWKILTPQSTSSLQEGIALVTFFNKVVGITPRRKPVEKRLAHVAASYVEQDVPEGSLVNVGAGLPEEVCYKLARGKWLDHVTLFTEAGAIGGVPAPGVFFGAAINPKKLISSPQTFRLAEEKLAASILGFLQVDSLGNVNASKRGENPREFVGPGGFVDFTHFADTIFFVGSWMNRGKMTFANQKLQIQEYGQPKFVEQVDQITFNGQEALKRNKRVFFFTNVGVFQLTPEGIRLIAIEKGVSLQKDIVGFSQAKILYDDKVTVLDP